MPRTPSHEITPAARHLFDALRRAQQRVERAESERDERAREAVAGGLSARSVGAALGTDGANAWRRYFNKANEGRR